MKIKSSANSQNQYMLAGITTGKKPMYVDMFTYIENTLKTNPNKKYFRKDELMSHTKYHCVNGELFSQLSNNGILVYDVHKKVWTFGPNYREYVNTYILEKPKFETYHMVLTKDRLMEKKPEISETNAKDLVKMMAKSKLRQAIDLLNEATEMLKSIE